MSVQQLQATLREHAAAVSDDALEGRAAASIARARTIRRRQALAVVAAAAVIGPLVGAAILGANPLERSAPPVHKPEKVPTVQAAFAGRELLDSAVVRDKGELTVTRETKVPTQWTVACYGVGSDYTVHATFDGAAAGAAPCEGLEPPEPQLGYVVDRRWSAGSHTMHVWLTREGSAEVVPAHGSVLTAGVYQLPPPVAVVAGADVYEREVAFGAEWQYAASRESAPGDRRLVAAQETGARLLARLVSTGLRVQDVRLLVDGVESDAAGVLDGNGYLPVLPAGRHTIDLRVVGAVPPAAQLGVVWREVVR